MSDYRAVPYDQGGRWTYHIVPMDSINMLDKPELVISDEQLRRYLGLDQTPDGDD